MLSGLSFLHSCEIIHTDIKPENVLLISPLMTPPVHKTTMYDVIHERINNDPNYQDLKRIAENPDLNPTEKKLAKARVKRYRAKLRNKYGTTGIPSLWGFFDFNVEMGDNEISEIVEEPLYLELQKSYWCYPDDFFYIKMFMACPLDLMLKALGPCHEYGERQCKCGVMCVCSEW